MVGGISIDRLDRPSAQDFLGHYVGRHQPVIMTGLIDDWRASSLWEPDYLRQQIGDLVLPIEVWEDGGSNNAIDWVQNRRAEKMPIARLLDLIEETGESRKYYLAGRPVPEPLLADLGPFTAYTGGEGRLANRLRLPVQIWMGPKGMISPLHYDEFENVLIQARGSKRVTLFSPSQSRLLYYPCFDCRIETSPIDVEAPDLAAFPRFKEATPIEVVLEQGEALYIPAFWWHHVRSLDRAISLNYWWRSPVRELQFARHYAYIAAQRVMRLVSKKARRYRLRPELPPDL